MTNRSWRWMAVAACLLMAAGCAEFQEIKGANYPESARLNYEEGRRQLESENYEVAQKYFALVYGTYSFSQYAAIAELMVGESLYKREMYGEAITSLKSFERNHPNHPCVTYARFRTAAAYYDQVPDDWWFMPPGFERDQEMTEKAMREYESVIQNEQAESLEFPKGYKLPKLRVCEGRNEEQMKALVYTARERAATCRKRLIDRERYVADFYASRGKPLGAVMRLENAVKARPELLYEADILEPLSQAYRDAHMYRHAHALLAYLQTQPGTLPPAFLEREHAALTEHEQAYEKRRVHDASKVEERKAKEAAFRKEHNLMALDPDPDPDLSYADLPYLAALNGPKDAAPRATPAP